MYQFSVEKVRGQSHRTSETSRRWRISSVYMFTYRVGDHAPAQACRVAAPAPTASYRFNRCEAQFMMSNAEMKLLLPHTGAMSLHRCICLRRWLVALTSNTVNSHFDGFDKKTYWTGLNDVYVDKLLSLMFCNRSTHDGTSAIIVIFVNVKKKPERQQLNWFPCISTKTYLHDF